MAVSYEEGKGYSPIGPMPIVSLVSPRFLRDAHALPLKEDERELALAMADPTDAYTIGAFRMATGREVKPLEAEEKPKQVAIIDENTCIGCTLCIQACPVDAIVGASRQLHTVIAAQCTGCELCLPPCPVHRDRVYVFYRKAEALFFKHRTRTLNTGTRERLRRPTKDFRRTYSLKDVNDKGERKRMLSGWQIMYCGGAKPVVDTLEAIHEKYKLPLRVESYAW